MRYFPLALFVFSAPAAVVPDRERGGNRRAENGCASHEVPRRESSAGNIVRAGSGVHPSASSWSFSDHPVGATSPPGKIYLTNQSPAPMDLWSSVGLSGFNVGVFSLSNGCSTAVAPYTTCELTFTFTPKAVGYREAKIEISPPQVQNGGFLFIPITGFGK